MAINIFHKFKNYYLNNFNYYDIYKRLKKINLNK